MIPTPSTSPVILHLSLLLAISLVTCLSNLALSIENSCDRSNPVTAKILLKQNPFALCQFLIPEHHGGEKQVETNQD